MDPTLTIPDRPGRHTPRRESSRTGGRTAFTLLELAVTITVIILVASLALPTITHMMASGADEQAHNLVTAQLMAARAHAITNENVTYAGIHVQMADPDAKNAEKDRCYSAVISYKTSDNFFRIADGFWPHRLPGTIALGEISADFITSGGEGNYKDLTDTRLKDFCSFSVIFSSTGSAVKIDVFFDSSDGTFKSGTNAHLWKHSIADGEKAVMAFTIFDYAELITRKSRDPNPNDDVYSREEYLNENGQFLPINVHTGLLFDRR